MFCKFIITDAISKPRIYPTASTTIPPHHRQGGGIEPLGIASWTSPITLKEKLRGDPTYLDHQWMVEYQSSYGAVSNINELALIYCQLRNIKVIEWASEGYQGPAPPPPIFRWTTECEEEGQGLPNPKPR